MADMEGREINGRSRTMEMTDGSKAVTPFEMPFLVTSFYAKYGEEYSVQGRNQCVDS